MKKFKNDTTNTFFVQAESPGANAALLQIDKERRFFLLCCSTRYLKPTSLLMVCSVARQINRREVRY